MTGLGGRDTGEPLAETQEVQSDGRQQMSQTGFAEPDVPGPAEATGADTAGERALNTSAFRVESDKVLGVLALARGLESLVLLPGPQGQGPAGASLGRTEAAGTIGASSAIIH